MDVLSSLLAKESLRNQNMIEAYQDELEYLPKGVIRARAYKDKRYYYLVYRNGNKVVTEYIGKDDNSLKVLQARLERRRQIDSILKK